MDHQLGKLLIVLGLIVVIAGFILYSGNGNIFSWIGNLPGDIRIKGENYSIYIPITTMILFSLVLTCIFWLFS